MKQFLLRLIPALFFCGHLCAQPFKPDANGFVNDQKFRTFIKDHSLQLVGRFDSLPIPQKVLVAAAIKNNAWIYIDVNGKEYPDKESVAKAFNMPYEQYVEKQPVNYSLDLGSDVPPPPVTEELREKQDELNFEEYARYQELYEGKGKIGYSYDDREIIPPVYAELKLEPSHGSFVFLARKDSLWGVLDNQGEQLIPLQYSSIRLIHKGSLRLSYLVQKNNQWGILSSTGEFSLPLSDYYPDVNPPFVKISKRAGDLKREGILDTNGRQVLPPVYNSINRVYNTSLKASGHYDLWQVTVGKRGAFRYGIADFNGRLLLDTLYSEIKFCGDSLRIVSIQTNGKKASGLFSLDTKQFVLPCEYQFDDGLSLSANMVYSKETDEGTRYGLISRKGRLIAPCIYSKIAFFPQDACIILEKDGKSGIYDLQMTEIVPMVHDKIVPISNEWVEYTCFPKGWFIFYKNGLAGVMDLDQEVKIANNYSSLEPSNTGLIYRKGEETGVLDANGKKVVTLTGGTITKASSGIVFWKNPQQQDILVDFYGNQTEKPRR